jgi:hypothetical protein
MPYLNLEAVATFRGRLPAENFLPQSGNEIGDMWMVNQTPWIWLRAPGAAKADWIDP